MHWMHTMHTLLQWGYYFRFISLCGSWCIHKRCSSVFSFLFFLNLLVFPPALSFSLHTSLKLAFRVAAHERCSPFVMVVKPVLLYLIFCFVLPLFLYLRSYPFLSLCRQFYRSTVISLHGFSRHLGHIFSFATNVATICCAHINSMSTSEPLEC